MTLNELKNDNRTLFYDNAEKAAKEWSKCWGLGWWFDLWRYKEYKLNNLTYRTGKVYFRHHNESIRKFYIDGKEVTQKTFSAALSEIEYQPKEIYIPTPKSETAPKETAKQLCFDF